MSLLATGSKRHIAVDVDRPTARSATSGRAREGVLQDSRTTGTGELEAPACAGLGLDLDRLDDPDCIMPLHVLLGVLRWGTRTTGDPLFALHVAEHLGHRSTLSYLVAVQPTLGDALRTLIKFQGLALRTNVLGLDATGDTPRLTVRMSLGAEELDDIADFILCRIMSAMSQMLRLPFSDMEVHLTRRSLANPAEYDRVFGCRVRMGQDCDAIVFPRHALALPLRTANGSVATYLEEPARAMLAALQDSFHDRIRAAVCETVRREEPCSRNALARRLAVSTRTLQRRLEEHGTGFRELVDDVRRELALELLTTSDHTLFEIAMRCGFSDQSAFNRACHRWTGTSPNVYRHGGRVAATNETVPSAESVRVSSPRRRAA